ncbi:MAG: hypothetical protein MK101_02065 [Phycisphaerales bacterium]|nr:hypothetical protein [Phycisphaerales bacterium]
MHDRPGELLSDEALDALDAAALEGASIPSDEDRAWLTENLNTLHERLQQ